MPRRTPASAPEPTPEHPLIAPLERLTEELKLVRTVLDEVRTDLQWALQNQGRVRDLMSRQNSLESASSAAGKLLTTFEEGDAVEVNDGEVPSFGEISSIDDAHNEATVILIPSNKVVTVSQDSISRVLPDQLRRAFDRFEEELMNNGSSHIPTAAEILNDQQRPGTGKGKLF